MKAQRHHWNVIAISVCIALAEIITAAGILAGWMIARAVR